MQRGCSSPHSTALHWEASCCLVSPLANNSSVWVIINASCAGGTPGSARFFPAVGGCQAGRVPTRGALRPQEERCAGCPSPDVLCLSSPARHCRAAQETPAPWLRPKSFQNLPTDCTCVGQEGERGTGRAKDEPCCLQLLGGGGYCSAPAAVGGAAGQMQALRCANLCPQHLQARSLQIHRGPIVKSLWSAAATAHHLPLLLLTQSPASLFYFLASLCTDENAPFSFQLGTKEHF